MLVRVHSFRFSNVLQKRLSSQSNNNNNNNDDDSILSGDRSMCKDELISPFVSVCFERDIRNTRTLTTKKSDGATTPGSTSELVWDETFSFEKKIDLDNNSNNNSGFFTVSLWDERDDAVVLIGLTTIYPLLLTSVFDDATKQHKTWKEVKSGDDVVGSISLSWGFDLQKSSKLETIEDENNSDKKKKRKSLAVAVPSPSPSSGSNNSDRGDSNGNLITDVGMPSAVSSLYADISTLHIPARDLGSMRFSIHSFSSRRKKNAARLFNEASSSSSSPQTAATGGKGGRDVPRILRKVQVDTKVFEKLYLSAVKPLLINDENETMNGVDGGNGGGGDDVVMVERGTVTTVVSGLECNIIEPIDHLEKIFGVDIPQGQKIQSDLSMFQMIYVESMRILSKLEEGKFFPEGSLALSTKKQHCTDNLTNLMRRVIHRIVNKTDLGDAVLVISQFQVHSNAPSSHKEGKEPHKEGKESRKESKEGKESRKESKEGKDPSSSSAVGNPYLKVRLKSSDVKLKTKPHSSTAAAGGVISVDLRIPVTDLNENFKFEVWDASWHRKKFGGSVLAASIFADLQTKKHVITLTDKGEKVGTVTIVANLELSPKVIPPVSTATTTTSSSSSSPEATGVEAAMNDLDNCIRRMMRYRLEKGVGISTSSSSTSSSSSSSSSSIDNFAAVGRPYLLESDLALLKEFSLRNGSGVVAMQVAYLHKLALSIPTVLTGSIGSDGVASLPLQPLLSQIRIVEDLMLSDHWNLRTARTNAYLDESCKSLELMARMCISDLDKYLSQAEQLLELISWTQGAQKKEERTKPMEGKPRSNSVDNNNNNTNISSNRMGSGGSSSNYNGVSEHLRFSIGIAFDQLLRTVETSTAGNCSVTLALLAEEVTARVERQQKALTKAGFVEAATVICEEYSDRLISYLYKTATASSDQEKSLGNVAESVCKSLALLKSILPAASDTGERQKRWTEIGSALCPVLSNHLKAKTTKRVQSWVEKMVERELAALSINLPLFSKQGDESMMSQDSNNATGAVASPPLPPAPAPSKQDVHRSCLRMAHLVLDCFLGLCLDLKQMLPLGVVRVGTISSAVEVGCVAIEALLDFFKMIAARYAPQPPHHNNSPSQSDEESGSDDRSSSASASNWLCNELVSLLNACEIILLATPNLISSVAVLISQSRQYDPISRKSSITLLHSNSLTTSPSRVASSESLDSKAHVTAESMALELIERSTSVLRLVSRVAGSRFGRYVMDPAIIELFPRDSRNINDNDEAIIGAFYSVLERQISGLQSSLLIGSHLTLNCAIVNSIMCELEAVAAPPLLVTTRSTVLEKMKLNQLQHEEMKRLVASWHQPKLLSLFMNYSNSRHLRKRLAMLKPLEQVLDMPTEDLFDLMDLRIDSFDARSDSARSDLALTALFRVLMRRSKESSLGQQRKLNRLLAGLRDLWIRQIERERIADDEDVCLEFAARDDDGVDGFVVVTSRNFIFLPLDVMDISGRIVIRLQNIQTSKLRSSSSNLEIEVVGEGSHLLFGCALKEPSVATRVVKLLSGKKNEGGDDEFDEGEGSRYVQGERLEFGTSPIEDAASSATTTSADEDVRHSHHQHGNNNNNNNNNSNRKLTVDSGPSSATTTATASTAAAAAAAGITGKKSTKGCTWTMEMTVNWAYGLKPTGKKGVVLEVAHQGKTERTARVPVRNGCAHFKHSFSATVSSPDVRIRLLEPHFLRESVLGISDVKIDCDSEEPVDSGENTYALKLGTQEISMGCGFVTLSAVMTPKN